MEQMILIDLFMPEKVKLATMLQNELSTDFEEVTVNWVDCPDLTQDPFYLSASGLCGDTALLDIGGISNLFPFPKKEKIFHFKNILQKLNRFQCNNFIIGGGLCARQPDEHLGELIMNASFLSARGKISLRNHSYFATDYSCHHKKEKSNGRIILINDENPNCNIYGNFFVSKGLREQVLKVQAKKRVGRDFIDALYHAICRFSRFHKTDSQLMGFGGTFIVQNGQTVHHVIQNDWTGPITTKDKIRDCIKYCTVQTPVVGFASFVSADRHIVNMKPGLKQVFLNRLCAYGYSANGGGYYHGTELNDNTEYLGYFSPATKLYRIDPVPVFRKMMDFSCL